jgi:signal transduction histidine kinase
MMNTARLTVSVWVFYWLVAGSFARAQQAPDSLFKYLKSHAPTDTTYIRAMDQAIFNLIYKKADYSRADSLGRQMADAATRLNYWSGLVGAYRNRASANYMAANYDQALVYFQKTVDAVEQYNLPPAMLYKALGNLASGYEKLGKDQLVLQTALRSIAVQERHQLKPRMPVPHRLIGGALVKMGKKQQAIPYYQEAGTIFRELGDPRGIAIFENQLGDFYQDLGQPKVALTHYQQSLTMAKQQKFDLLQADVLDGLAQAMNSLNRPDEGLSYAQQALTIAEKQQQPLGICTSYNTMGSLYRTKQDYAQAEAYFRKAIALSEQHNYKDELKKNSQQLADLLGQQNKFQQAYVFQLRKNNLTDSATLVRTNAEIERLLIQYETEKKEARIRLLQKEKQLEQEESDQAHWQRNALLTGAILVILLGMAIGAWLLNRARVQRLQEAIQLRQQIAHDLHDEVGSTLSSISLLSGHTNDLLNQNRPETAQKMVQKIYTDARQILESIDEIIWTINPGNDSLQRIVLRLQEYAQPLMESKQIAFSFYVDPALDQLPVSMEVRRNLYLIGKEAINNLVKYSEATRATLRFERQNNQFKVVIEDNGRGFDPSQLSNRTGQQSMQQRATAMGGKLTVRSVPGQGTTLELTSAAL